MPTPAELTAPYEDFMLAPQRGPGVCEICFNLTAGYARCYACAHGELWLDSVSPISYSVAHEHLHRTLVGYKRWSGPPAGRMAAELAAVLSRYLLGHEGCVARAARVRRFDLVTTVPGGTPGRDSDQPLRRLVEQAVIPVRERYERLLVRTSAPTVAREFDPDRFAARRVLPNSSVLLLDDTWTTGVSAQSAAAVLKAAGAQRVAAVVIGRHVNRSWQDNDRHLRALASPFSWSSCALCARPAPGDAERLAAVSRPLEPVAQTP